MWGVYTSYTRVGSFYTPSSERATLFTFSVHLRYRGRGPGTYSRIKDETCLPGYTGVGVYEVRVVPVTLTLGIFKTFSLRN